MNSLFRSFLFVFLCILTSGCQPGQIFGHTVTPSLTVTNTPTSTFTYTPTLTPTLTPTSTNTFTPTATFTVTPTPTLVPMSQVSKNLITKVRNKKFEVEPNACMGERSCQAFLSKDPYMVLIVYNDGRIVMEVNDESTIFDTYVKPEGVNPPYRTVFNWLCDYFYDFFYKSVTDNYYDFPLILDMVTANGTYSMETSYSYLFSGKQKPENKITIIMEPIR